MLNIVSCGILFEFNFNFTQKLNLFHIEKACNYSVSSNEVVKNIKVFESSNHRQKIFIHFRRIKPLIFAIYSPKLQLKFKKFDTF